MYTDATGTEQYLTIQTPLANGSTTVWQQYTGTFTLPQNATSVTLFMLISSNGWLQVDDYSVTAQPVVGFTQPLVSLTFDDGLSSTYKNGLPILQKYGFVSTQYLISGTLNTSTYMTTANARAFLTQGSEIGSHTVTHPYLTQLTAPLMTQELSQSQVKLRSLFGTSVAQNFASPYGDYNLNVINTIKTYYRSHRSVDVGYNSKDNFNPYNIRVQNVDSTTTPAQVAAWVAKAKADKTWLVLVYHAVVNGGDAYSVTPVNLDTELANIKASGVSVKTINQALDIITPQL
jgi:peptidoglycan/xylan/chitin deacetylase (PgdA/CDA1 family)